MIDRRLYRLSFLPAVLVLVVAMFSLEGTPDALEPITPPSTFEGDRAASVARQIANSFPDRTPGSAGDASVADLVESRFDEIPAGAVAEQEFEASVGGEDVGLRNVLLTLPGDAEKTILVVAARDTSSAPGAASTAAATGILVELANALRVSHEKTFVLASITGSTVGGAGVRALIDNLPERDAIEAVVVISQPGSAAPVAPYVVSSSTSTRSPSVQIERTAERAVEVQAQRPSEEPGAFSQLARLAIPSGLGDQAPLIGEGVDAIAISSAGERPLAAADDQIDDLSTETVDAFGRAVQSTVSALDVTVPDPVHGPRTHLELGENLLPGWALAALALALLLPALATSIDACARGSRRDLPLVAAIAWAAARSLPFVGALLGLYALTIVGAIPSPDFPFDPSLYALGGRAAATLGAIVLIAGASAWLLRRRGLTAAKAPEPAACACGAVGAVAAIALWVANPYLALLAVPLAHVWPLAVREPPTRARGLATVGAAIVASLPLLAAAGAVSGALDLGSDAPWTFALMVADGQIGLLSVLSLAFLAGSVLGALALAVRRPPHFPEAG